MALLDGALEDFAGAVASQGARLWRMTLPGVLAGRDAGRILRRAALSAWLSIEIRDGGGLLSLRLRDERTVGDANAARLRVELAAVPPDEGPAPEPPEGWRVRAPAWCVLPGAGWQDLLPPTSGAPLLLRLPSGGVLGVTLPRWSEAPATPADPLGARTDRKWTNLQLRIAGPAGQHWGREPGEAWPMGFLRSVLAALSATEAADAVLPAAGPVHDLAREADAAWSRLQGALRNAAPAPSAAALGMVAYAVACLQLDAEFCVGPEGQAPGPAGPPCPGGVASLSTSRLYAGRPELRVAGAAVLLPPPQADQVHAALLPSVQAPDERRRRLLASRSARRAVFRTGGGGAAPLACLLWLDDGAGEEAFLNAVVRLPPPGGHDAQPAGPWRWLDGAPGPDAAIAPDAPLAAQVMRVAGQAAEWWRAVAGIGPADR